MSNYRCATCGYDMNDCQCAALSSDATDAATKIESLRRQVEQLTEDLEATKKDKGLYGQRALQLIEVGDG